MASGSPDPAAPATGRVDGWRRLAIASAVATYLLIVLGGIVRITGSGMGCGDDWPLCNGEILPPLDLPTLIEYGHRLAAAFVSVLVVGLGLWSAFRRRAAGWSRRARYGVAAVVLLVVQVLLGAVTVWLELPPASVILHLGTAMALLAVLVLAAVGAADGEPRGPAKARPGGPRMATSLVVLSALVVLLGALVANLGAAPACQGFPLCNGSWLPGGHWRIHLHWLHRFLAYALVAGAIALPWVDRARRGLGALVAGLAMAQLGVAAVMVLEGLPGLWRALHVALGTGVFAALVAHAYLANRRPEAGVVRDAAAGPDLSRAPRGEVSPA